MNWGIHDRRGWMAVVLLLCDLQKVHAGAV